MFYNQVRGKAIQGYQRPSMNEYLGPLKPYKEGHAALQIRYSYELGAGVGFLLFCIAFAIHEDGFPTYKTDLFKLQMCKDAEEKLTKTYENEEAKLIEKEVIENKEVENDLIDEEESMLLRENVPKSPNGYPENVTYLLIGGGTASFSAFRSLKAKDARAKILIVSGEEVVPYMRPPLTKELWYSERTDVSDSELMFKGLSGRERNLFFEKEAFYTPLDSLEFNEKGGTSVLTGHEVIDLDAEKKIATLDDGRKIKFEKCLIATGGSPKQLSVFDGFGKDHVSTFRSVQDYKSLEKLVSNGQVKSVAVIGGGFLGSELAYSLNIKSKEKKLGLKITQIIAEKGILMKILPEYLSNWAVTKLKAEGIQVLNESKVQYATLENGKVKIQTDQGANFEFDHVVVSVGIQPNNQLAQKAGLEIDVENGGILANSKLKSSNKSFFVAGDVASYFHSDIGKKIQLGHHDNAISTGRLAGENMAGGEKDTSGLLMFWSDLGMEVGVEGIGVIDSSLETVGVYARSDDKKEASEDNFDRGVVFYKDENEIVVGVLMWNIFNHMAVARKVVRENRKYEDLTEVAKLFNLYKKPSEESEEPQKETDAKDN